jgi:hypothetical protein
MADMDKQRNRSVWDRIAIYSAAVGALGTLIAVGVSIRIANGLIREMRDEAKIQHLVEESSQFDQGPLFVSRKALAAKRIDRKNEVLRPLDVDDPPDEMYDVLNACDHVGLLTKRGYLDVADVWSEMGYWLFYVYADAQPMVEADRKTDPASMANCSWLIGQMRPIEIKNNGGVQLHPSPDNLYQFYAGEVDAEPGKPPARGPRR